MPTDSPARGATYTLVDQEGRRWELGPNVLDSVPATTSMPRELFIGRKLGKGTFGGVYSLLDGTNPSGLALKKGRASTVYTKRMLTRGARFFRELYGEPVHLSFSEQRASYTLIFKHLPGRTLRTLLSSFRLSRLEKLRIIQAVFMALQTQLHAKGIFHGDLNAENILVARRGKAYQVYFVDFDYSYRKGETATGVYISPSEVCYFFPGRDRFDCQLPANAYQDIYSLAYCLYRYALQAEQSQYEFLCDFFRGSPCAASDVVAAIKAELFIEENYPSIKAYRKDVRLLRFLIFTLDYEEFKVGCETDYPNLKEMSQQMWLRFKRTGFLKYYKLFLLDYCCKKAVREILSKKGWTVATLQWMLKANSISNFYPEEESVFAEVVATAERVERLRNIYKSEDGLELVQLISVASEEELFAWLGSIDAALRGRVKALDIDLLGRGAVCKEYESSLLGYCLSDRQRKIIMEDCCGGVIGRLRAALTKYLKRVSDAMLRQMIKDVKLHSSTFQRYIANEYHVIAKFSIYLLRQELPEECRQASNCLLSRVINWAKASVQLDDFLRKDYKLLCLLSVGGADYAQGLLKSFNFTGFTQPLNELELDAVCFQAKKILLEKGVTVEGLLVDYRNLLEGRRLEYGELSRVEFLVSWRGRHFDRWGMATEIFDSAMERYSLALAGLFSDFSGNDGARVSKFFVDPEEYYKPAPVSFFQRNRRVEEVRGLSTVSRPRRNSF